MTVILGAHNFRKNETGQVRVSTKNTLVHENWIPQFLLNDIALVKFSHPVELSGKLC